MPDAEKPSSNDRIIGATLELINEQGLGGVTMSRIADAAGVARQTLYNHYPDIDTIVATAVTRHNRESIELLETALIVAATPEEKLEQLIRHVVAVGAHAGHGIDIQYGLSADARASLSDYGNIVNGHIRDILVAGMGSQTFRSDLDPDIDTVLVQHILSGTATLAARSPDDAAHIKSTATNTIMAAVGAASGN